MSLSVVDAVAAETGVEPADLDRIVADVVDPVALDRVFESTPGRERTAGCVEFPFCGYAIPVSADGIVTVQ